MNYYGIDYGLGRTNIDTSNGIRYGVIPLRSLGEFAADDFEPDYGEPTCGECGTILEAFDHEKHGHYEGASTRASTIAEYACDVCEIAISADDDVLPEDPIGWFHKDGGILAHYGEDADVWIEASPFYTHAAFCSPCAPGAGHLLTPVDIHGPRVYCLPHEWFDGDVAPYPVFRVEDGTRVEPPAKEIMTCGTCGRTWDAVKIPTPAARCPYEYEHPEPVANRVSIEITLGNDDMRSRRDVLHVLALAFQDDDTDEPLTLGSKGNIRDENGNTVGTWRVDS